MSAWFLLSGYVRLYTYVWFVLAGYMRDKDQPRLVYQTMAS